MFEQLIRKDIQNQKGILLLGLFFLIAPYGFWLFGNRETHVLANCANLSLVASMLTIVVMGATIIGLERQNRGMDFLLGLPVSRSKILLSKAVICLVVAAIIWAAYFIITEAFLSSEWHSSSRPFAFGTMFVGFLVFSVAWLASTIFRGTAISVGTAMAVTTFVLIAVAKYASHQDWEIADYGNNVLATLNPICFVLGVAAFVLGWLKFVKRCEP